MKLTVRYKKMPLSFYFGFGFMWFIFVKCVYGGDKFDAQKLKRLGEEIKILLKNYKRTGQKLILAEIERAGKKVVEIKF